MLNWNVTSFLSKKWLFEQSDTDHIRVVVLQENTVRIQVNICLSRVHDFDKNV